MQMTPKRLLSLLLLAHVPLLAACQTIDPLAPDAARFAPVSLPVAPEGEAQCEEGPCLSQRQVDLLFNETIDALCEANDKLAWLHDFYLGTQLEASCD